MTAVKGFFLQMKVASPAAADGIKASDLDLSVLSIPAIAFARRVLRAFDYSAHAKRDGRTYPARHITTKNGRSAMTHGVSDHAEGHETCSTFGVSSWLLEGTNGSDQTPKTTPTT